MNDRESIAAAIAAAAEEHGKQVARHKGGEESATSALILLRQAEFRGCPEPVEWEALSAARLVWHVGDVTIEALVFDYAFCSPFVAWLWQHGKVVAELRTKDVVACADWIALRLREEERCLP